MYHYFVEAATLKLSFEKLKPAIFKNIDCVSESLCKSFAGAPSYGNFQYAV